jgi:O-6-methylguanine DNA methyltransferase
MDHLDEALKDFFAVPGLPGLAGRLVRGLRAAPERVDRPVERFRIVATDAGIRRLEYRRGRDETSGRGGRRHAERARAELREYLDGRRTFFSVPIDLAGIPQFQAKVLAAARRIPFGEVDSYAALARRIGHPRAARAVGNALGANPVPIFVPCHRIIRGDGSWGHYAFGAPMKTQLLRLERSTPSLVGCSSTRIVCRRGCAHEQRMGEDRRVVFASVDDAVGVGYRPCRVCAPARAAS